MKARYCVVNNMRIEQNITITIEALYFCIIFTIKYPVGNATSPPIIITAH
jgi:hypothetical protein